MERESGWAILPSVSQSTKKDRHFTSVKQLETNSPKCLAMHTGFV